MTTDELRAKFEAWARRNICCDLDAARNEVQAAWRAYQSAHASRDAEVEALRKDAERLDALENLIASGERVEFARGLLGNGVAIGLRPSWMTECRSNDLRSCIDQIDAAMREEKA